MINYNDDNPGAAVAYVMIMIFILLGGIAGYILHMIKGEQDELTKQEYEYIIDSLHNDVQSYSDSLANCRELLHKWGR